MSPPRESFLDSRHAPLAVMLVALLLVLPSTNLGFFSDDYVFLSQLEGTASWVPTRWDLYNFIPGPPETARMIADGDLPWWSADGLRLHLVRPLTSALLVLDHTVFGRWAVGYHLHCAAWWLLLVAVVSRYFRENFPRRIATLASLLFAVSGAHGMVYAWIACRHLLVAGVFGVLTLSLVQRALREARPLLGIASAVPLLLALGASEAALGIVPFLIFAAYFHRGEDEGAPSLRERLVPIVAPLVITAGYFVFYKAMGGGSVHGGTYVDPLSSPLRFATLGAERLPMLLASALLGIPVEASSGVGNGAFVVMGLLSILAVAGLCRALWPAIPVEARAALRFSCPAALLAIVVGIGGIPGSRQLVLPNLFFAPLFACVLLHGLPRESDGARGPRFARRAGAAFLACLHVPFAIFVGLAGVAGMKEMRATVHRLALTPILDEPRRFFLLGTSDPLITMYTPPMHAVEKRERVRPWSVLAMTKGNTLVERTDEARLVFEIENGHMLTNPFETLVWDPAVPMPVGHERVQCGATIRVLATREGKPSRVQVTFDASLDGEDIVILQWKDQRLVPLRLAVGDKTRLVWSPGPMGLL